MFVDMNERGSLRQLTSQITLGGKMIFIGLLGLEIKLGKSIVVSSKNKFFKKKKVVYKLNKLNIKNKIFQMSS